MTKGAVQDGAQTGQGQHRVGQSKVGLWTDWELAGQQQVTTIEQFKARPGNRACHFATKLTFSMFSEPIQCNNIGNNTG